VSSGSGPEVVVIGNVGVDTNVYLHGETIDLSREASFTENLDCVGQAGGYTSRGYARLGYRTAFIGHVGEDPAGRQVREELAGDGIDLTALGLDPAGTARSVNLIDTRGRRKNFYDGKGHLSLRVDPELCRPLLARARLAHVHLPDWARHLLPLAAELRRQTGLVIACDLQDVTDPDEAYRQDFVAAADILFFSAVNHPTPDPLIEAFLGRRPEAVVVAGMGAAGCALGTREGGIRYFPAVELPAPVVDTNGAGDGLAVGFLTSHILEGRGLPDAILRGQITARHTCTLRGTSAELITREELERHVEARRATRADPSPGPEPRPVPPSQT